MSALRHVVGICGYSGSGKTTLIEALVPKLLARRWRVAVVKHDCHGLRVDCPGKDTHRFFAAGADVVAQGPGESFLRMRDVPSDLDSALRVVGARYDVVLVEGHKTSPVTRKLWLLSEGESAPPETAGVVDRVLGRQEDRVALALAWIENAVSEGWSATPVYAGILVGGRATRMGQAKHLLAEEGRTWLERIAESIRTRVEQVVLVGAAMLPAAMRDLTCLPDVPGMAGPLAGMLSAMRWQPVAGWLFVACDMPRVSPEAVDWLLGWRRPGTWAVLPRRLERPGVEPLLAYYDPRAYHLLEPCRGPAEITRWPQAATPVVPEALSIAWDNVNTPEELDAYRRGRPALGARCGEAGE